jgi:hypothetical protein
VRRTSRSTFARRVFGCSDRLDDLSALVGVGEGVQVLLSGLDLGVAHPFHHGYEVGAAGEQPGGVGVAQVVDADGEVDPAGLDRGKPSRGRWSRVPLRHG